MAIVAVPEGAALARRLVDEGATVVLAGVDAEEAGRILAELGDGPGRAAFFAGADDVDGLVEFIAEQFKSAQQFKAAQQFGEGPPVS